jgi:predicted protein tyrosine phosphatase
MTEALLMWADLVLVMDEDMQREVNGMQNDLFNDMDGHMFDYDFKQVINLDIPDDYDYRNPKLVKLMTDKFYELFPHDVKDNA